MSRFDVHGGDAVLLLDDGKGGLSDQPTDHLPLDQFSVLRNASPKGPGLLRQRGPITQLDGGTYGQGISVSLSAFEIFASEIKTGAALTNPYVFAGYTVSATGPRVVYLGAAGTTLVDLGVVALNYSNIGTLVTDSVGANGRGAMFGDRLVLPCSAVGTNRTPVPGPGVMVRGFNLPYTTGTVTATNGSAAVVGAGTTWTSAMVGRWFIVRDELTTTQHVYRVATFVDATHITLSSVFKGATGGGQAYAITEQAHTQGDQTIWSDGKPRFVACLNAWQRLVVLNYSEVPSDASLPDRWVPNGLRWTGIEGSSEGALVGDGVGQGLDGWHSNGKLLLPATFGAGLGLARVGTSVVAMLQRGMVAISGQPAFDTPAGLNMDRQYDVGCSGTESFVNTPFGFFFYDRTHGLMRWDGSSTPVSVSDIRMRQVLEQIMGRDASPTIADYGVHLGYHRDHLYMCDSRTGGALLVYLPTMAWSQLTGDAACSMLYMRQGRTRDATLALDTPLISVQQLEGSAATQGRVYSGTNSATNLARYLQVLSDVVDKPGTASFDWTGTPIIAGMKSGRSGVRGRRMHARRYSIDGICESTYAQSVAGMRLVAHGGLGGVQRSAAVAGGRTVLASDDASSGALTSKWSTIASAGTSALWAYYGTYAPAIAPVIGADANLHAISLNGSSQSDSLVVARLGVNAAANQLCGIIAKSQDATNQGVALYIDLSDVACPVLRLRGLVSSSYLYFTHTSPSFYDPCVRLAGHQALFGSTSPSRPGSAWLMLRTSGNIVVGHLFDEDPVLGGVPIASLSTNLADTATAVAKFGSGVSGLAGVFNRGRAATNTFFSDVWCGTMPTIGGTIESSGSDAPANQVDRAQPSSIHGFLQSQREPMIGVSAYNEFPAKSFYLDQVALECKVASRGDTT